MNKTKSGFTIIELLIVIVVIAILAAIVIVAFSGIQARAHGTSIRSDIRNNASLIENFNAINGRYPTTSEVQTLKLRASKQSYYTYIGTVSGSDVYIFNFLYCVSGDGTKFALASYSKGGMIKYVSGQGVSTYAPSPGWSSTDDMCDPLAGSSYSAIWGFKDATWQSWVN